MDKREFAHAFEQETGRSLNKGQVNKVFRQADFDSDGEMDIKEFHHAKTIPRVYFKSEEAQRNAEKVREAREGPEYTKEMVKEMFSKMDMDGDNKVYVEEWQKAHGLEHMPKLAAMANHGVMDLNSDGAVTLGELEGHILKGEMPGEAHYAKKLINAIDTNKDGVFDTKEVAEAYNGFTGKKLSEEQLNGMFKHCDYTKDGVLNEDELACVIANM